MTFEEMLDHALAMLQRRGRVTYRALQRQFYLADDTLNDLKDALLYAHPEVHDEGRGLVWTGGAAPPSGRSPVSCGTMATPGCGCGRCCSARDGCPIVASCCYVAWTR